MVRALSSFAVMLVLSARVTTAAAAGVGSDEEKLTQRAAIIASLKPAVVFVENDTARGLAWGTGFIVSSDGYIITNQHVVARTQGLTVYYRNSVKIPARLVAEDDLLDVAIIKVESNRDLPTVTLGDSNVDVLDGAEIAVTGYPLPNFLSSVGLGLDSSTSAGSINAYRLGNTTANRNLNALIQLDALVKPGNSGGPVYRSDNGVVVGVATYGGQGVIQGMNFAVPINQVKGLLASANIVLKPNIVKPESVGSIVEPGRAEILNMIGRNGELSPLFAKTSSIRVETSAISRTLVSFLSATGSDPPLVSEMTTHSGLFYFGSQDRYVRAYQPRRFGPEEAWTFEAEYPVFYAPAISNDTLVASSGVLNYMYDDSKRRFYGSIASHGASVMQFNRDAGGILALGGLLGGLFSKPKTDLETNGIVYSLGRTDGRLKAQLKTAFPSAPVVKDNTAFVGGLGALTALDVNSGDIKWNLGGKVKGNEIILDKPRDSRIWYNIALGSDDVLYALMTPVKMILEKGRGFELEVGGEHHGTIRLAAIDTKNGKELWHVEFMDLSRFSRPLSTNLQLEERADFGRMAYCSIGELVFAVDLAAKKIAWPKPEAARKRWEEMKKRDEALQKQIAQPNNEEADERAHLRFSRGFVIGDGRLYIGSSDRNLLAYDCNTGEEVAKFPTVGGVGSPLFYQGAIYFGTTEGTKRGTVRGSMYAVDAKTMTAIWRFRTPNAIVDRPVIIDDVLYAGSVVSGDQPTEIFAIPLPKR